MSSDRLLDLHEVVKEPLRHRIFLKLGQYNSLDFNDLLKSLKISDSLELSNQLSILEEITVEGEHLVTKQENSYRLTEKGHEVLDKIIVFPELTFDDYKEKLSDKSSQPNQSKPKPKWFTPYWVAIFVSTIIVMGIVIPLFTNQSLDKAIFYTIIASLAIGLAYYARVKPSVTLNKLVYIGLLGFVIGVVIWFLSLAIVVTSFRTSLPHTDATENTVFIVLTTVSFTVGPIVGYLIGKARHFKGPQQYSP